MTLLSMVVAGERAWKATLVGQPEDDAEEFMEAEWDRQLRPGLLFQYGERGGGYITIVHTVPRE